MGASSLGRQQGTSARGRCRRNRVLADSSARVNEIRNSPHSVYVGKKKARRAPERSDRGGPDASETVLAMAHSEDFGMLIRVFDRHADWVLGARPMGRRLWRPNSLRIGASRLTYVAFPARRSRLLWEGFSVWQSGRGYLLRSCRFIATMMPKGRGLTPGSRDYGSGGPGLGQRSRLARFRGMEPRFVVAVCSAGRDWRKRSKSVEPVRS
jgi:hypothetical protein